MKLRYVLLLIILTVPLYVMILGVFFALPYVITEQITAWEAMISLEYALGMRCFLAVAIAAVVAMAIAFSDNKSLDNIKMRTAGNGQYGTARWATSKERNDMYPHIAAGSATKSGVVIEYDKTSFRVDASDNNLMILAPPGAGKTKDFYIPSIIYNCRVNRNTNGAGASMIIVDVKGEEYRETAEIARQSGYTVRSLDYRHPLTSDMNNMLHAVNLQIDRMRAATTEQERILHRARAERHAKILSSAIMNTAEVKTAGGTESSQFFNTTAEGLITAMILVVSEYGTDAERHLPSVFRLMIELNGLVQSEDMQNDTVQKSRLKELLSVLPEDNRAKLFAGASMNADVRTSMNIFSSAMAKLLNFVDSELEQMICGHSEGFSPEEFVEQPTIIYLVVPDEDSTRHLFSSLFIRQMLTDLLSYANEQDDLALPRKVLFFWDEFGNSPAVKDLATQFTAARSRGIRLIIALQSLAQLEERYGRSVAKIIRDATQMTMFSFVAPTATETAQELSRALGKFTTQAGSRSKGEKNSSQSRQLIGRELMMPDEIMQLPIGTFVVMKSGRHPIKTNLKPFNMVWKNLPKANDHREPRPIRPIEVLGEEKIIARAGRLPLYKGMLDGSPVMSDPSPFTEEQDTALEPPKTKKGFRKKRDPDSE